MVWPGQLFERGFWEGDKDQLMGMETLDARHPFLPKMLDKDDMQGGVASLIPRRCDFFDMQHPSVTVFVLSPRWPSPPLPQVSQLPSHQSPLLAGRCHKCSISEDYGHTVLFTAVFHPYHTVGDVGLQLRSLGHHTQPVGVRSLAKDASPTFPS